MFGSNQVVIKQVADAGVDDFTQMFLRFAVATTRLTLLKAPRGRDAKGRDALGDHSRGGALFADHWAGRHQLGALTSTFTVLSVPLFAGASGQKVPWFTWPADICAIFGVSLLTGGDESGFVQGDALCILSAIIFGYFTFRSSKHAQLF